MQLKLFTRNTSRALQIAHKGKRIRAGGPTQLANNTWDLWTQQTNAEKEMVLLFLDIRNFTPLVESCGPTEVMHFIKSLITALQVIIRKHHGRIIETTGDGFYAAFGFDCSIQKAQNDAVKASYGMLHKIELLNSRSIERNLRQRIDIGIGLHTGKVATGTINLGTEDHMLVMGYAVNVASRLQTATKELNNNFIISGDVFEGLDEPPQDKQKVKAILKGVTNPIDVYLMGKAYR